MPQDNVFYTSKEEAERQTGYFYIGSLGIRPALANKIDAFINKNGIVTYSRESKRKTSFNQYTLNFTLLRYYKDPKRDLSEKYSVISHRGALGYLKLGLTTKRTYVSELACGHPGGKTFVHGPTESGVAKYEEIKAKTPELSQMYFWICRKYPSGIIFMSYATEPSTWGRSENLNDTDELED
jgi:hypothetical protein